MYTEDELISLSALNHFLYCERRCALIHLDQTWTENIFTAEGRLLHEKADSGKVEVRGDIKTATGLLLRSLKYGLTGKADMVEFHRRDKVWVPYPVEYKRGRPKKNDSDRVQLCAQALCLEEMLGMEVPEGSLFYGQTKRRQVVPMDLSLRAITLDTIADVRVLLNQENLPPPVNDKRCKDCSLAETCMPKILAAQHRASRYLESLKGDP
ncbi:CRISPR-associated protein Cas4 [Desulfosarcina sp. OttesenSCG-928-A07]|nr:CRISPR-associated protein Cas4 [Desulfosarcina sp. OttesenSCG-928-G17]MDL2329587.1 CRISPR-associated protein Cas4 [Desulfosarcina sp. OttesenSCG-928-A07]